MFTKLLLATSAIGALSVPVANYQHTTQEGNVNITYQYETNDVNSIDDLVVGNVYHFYVDGSDQLGLDDIAARCYLDLYIVSGHLTFSYSDQDIDEINQPIVLVENSPVYIDFSNVSLTYYIGSFDDSDNYASIAFNSVFDIDFDFDFVLLSVSTENDFSFPYIDARITASDYNVITNVQEVYHTGLFGNLADFLRYHIYGGIPHVTDIQFEIANQTITMLDWLVTTTSIALAIVALFILYGLFRSIFKLVSGRFLLR